MLQSHPEPPHDIGSGRAADAAEGCGSETTNPKKKYQTIPGTPYGDNESP